MATYRCTKCFGRNSNNCTRCAGTGREPTRATHSFEALGEILGQPKTLDEAIAHEMSKPVVERQSAEQLYAERERRYREVQERLSNLDQLLASETYNRRAGDANCSSDLNALASNLRKEVESLRGQVENTRKLEITLHQGETSKTLDSSETYHPKFEKLLKIASSRDAGGFAPNIWISGPAGSGKTSGARQLAKALDRPFFYNGALSTDFQVLGYKDAGGTYHSTAFRDAITQPSVYLFDDIDSCDSNAPLLALNGALANGLVAFPDAQVARHPDCICIATANTWGLGATADYVGRVRIDAAFLSRFPARLHWGYDEQFEQQICGNMNWAKRVQRARKAASDKGLKVVIDPRASIAGAALLASGFEEVEVAELTYLANLTPDQRESLSEGNEGPSESPNTIYPCRLKVRKLLEQLRLLNRIEAIKIYRDLTGLGLREAEDAIYAILP